MCQQTNDPPPFFAPSNPQWWKRNKILPREQESMSCVILIEKLKFEEGELTGFYLEPSIDFDIKWGIFYVKIIM